MRRQPEIQGLLVPLLGLLLAACPEQLGQQCPPQTVALGQYALSRAGRHPAGECVATQADGGGSPAPLVLDDGGVVGATICFGTGTGGGPELKLVVPGNDAGPSDLLPDGGFHFTGHSDPFLGTPCACAVAIDETFDGFLETTPPGPIALQPDGGLPRITGVTGSLTDTLSTDAGSGCRCNLPCLITYSVSGTRF